MENIQTNKYIQQPYNIQNILINYKSQFFGFTYFYSGAMNCKDFEHLLTHTHIYRQELKISKRNLLIFPKDIC